MSASVSWEAKRAWIRAAAPSVVLLATLLGSRSARGEGEGDCPAAEQWARACGREHGIEVVAERCDDKRAIVRIANAGADAIRVEVTPSPGAAFRRVGSVGLSPLLDIDDWERQVPEPTRRAFDAFAECAKKGIPKQVFARRRTLDVASNRKAATIGLSWRVLAGIGLSAACFVLALKRAAQRRSKLVSSALSLLALMAATVVFRRFAVAPAFFHQNGQGPAWIDFYTSGPDNEYGPGFFDLFGVWAQRWPGGAYDGVFTAQSLLAATSAPLAWIIARCLGSRPRMAWIVAALVAVNPLFARMAGSESYFAACTSLLFGATAVLAATTRRLAIRSPIFWLGATAAGLFVAQAARIHAYSWIPAAASPLVILAGAGRLSRRVRAAATAASIIAVVVALAALPAMLSVLKGTLGARWTPRAESVLSLRNLPLWLIAVAGMAALGFAIYKRPWGMRVLTLAALVASAWAAGAFAVLLLPIAALSFVTRPGRGFVQTWALAVLVVLARVTKLQLALVPVWIDGGYVTLYLPAVLAVVTALAARASVGRARTWLTLATLLAGCVATLATWRPMTTLATDVLEEMRVASWPSLLPAGATVGYLGWAGDRVQTLPRNFPGEERIQLDVLDGRGGPVDLETSGDAYYFRSSLCTSPEGRTVCDTIERRYELEPVDEAVLPARPSMFNLGYDRPVVTVTLYRVAGRRE
jgi:hypothetical protein